MKFVKKKIFTMLTIVQTLIILLFMFLSAHADITHRLQIARYKIKKKIILSCTVKKIKLYACSSRFRQFIEEETILKIFIGMRVQILPASRKVRLFINCYMENVDVRSKFSCNCSNEKFIIISLILIPLTVPRSSVVGKKSAFCTQLSRQFIIPLRADIMRRVTCLRENFVSSFLGVQPECHYMLLKEDIVDEIVFNYN